MSNIRGLRDAAALYFAPHGASVSKVKTVEMPGVFLLGKLFPNVFGPLSLETFSVRLPDATSPHEAFEVSARRGQKGIEVVRDYPVSGLFGTRVEREVMRTSSQLAVRAKLGLPL